MSYLSGSDRGESEPPSPSHSSYSQSDVSGTVTPSMSGMASPPADMYGMGTMSPMGSGGGHSRRHSRRASRADYDWGHVRAKVFSKDVAKKGAILFFAGVLFIVYLLSIVFGMLVVAPQSSVIALSPSLVANISACTLEEVEECPIAKVLRCDKPGSTDTVDIAKPAEGNVTSTISDLGPQTVAANCFQAITFPVMVAAIAYVWRRKSEKCAQRFSPYVPVLILLAIPVSCAVTAPSSYYMSVCLEDQLPSVTRTQSTANLWFTWSVWQFLFCVLAIKFGIVTRCGSRYLDFGDKDGGDGDDSNIA